VLYLVTGGAGFIGSNLVRMLAEQGSRVRLLDNFDTGSRNSAHLLTTAFPDRVEVIEGDIRDRALCGYACSGADYVLHHAAMASVPRSFANPAECAEVNISGTVSILDAALASGSVRRVVFASSCAVYANSRRSAIPETARIDPISPYAACKYASELFCRSYSLQKGLSTLVFRYFNVYGDGQNPAGDYAAVIPRFLDAAVKGMTAVVYGDGRQVRDFVYVEDVARANLIGCSADGVGSEPFNIGSGSATSLNTLISDLSTLTRRPVSVHHAPPRAGDIRRSVASIERAERILGYKPETTLRSGLKKLLTRALK